MPLPVLALVLGLCGPPLQAQELVPRAYWPAPVGTSVLVAGYQFSTGDIITDPTLPISGVESDINYGILTYQRFGELFGRTMSIQISQPYTWGKTQGFLDQQFVDRHLDGRGDLRMRMSINLAGAAAMDRAGMQALRANPRTIVGLSLSAIIPTGSYNAERLLNVGSNRWALKPALGVIWPMRPTWLLEAEVGVWLFGDNDDFLGATRRQDPIWTGAAYLIKRIRPGFWMSLDLNYYAGGKTGLTGAPKTNLQRNSRAGATLVFPFGGNKNLRFSYSQGVTTRAGGDYRLYQLSFLRAW